MSNYSFRNTTARQLRDQQRLQNNNQEQEATNHLRSQENDQGQIIITARGVAPANVFDQQQVHRPASPVHPIMTTSYVTNPFTGDINPGDTSGMKLYLKATDELKEKLTISQAHARDISTHFETDARNFAWGKIINMIKTSAADTTGTSILTNYRDLKLENVQKQAYQIWGDRTATYATALPATFTVQHLTNIDNDADEKSTFHSRVRAEMIAKRIENSVTTASWKTLMLKKADFTWTNLTTGEIHLDGGTMLFILLSKINPSTRVGVSGLKLLISSATLAAFNHNVISLLNDMATNYARIVELGGSHEDYLLHIFAALLTTTNEIFRQFIQAEKNKWELGEAYLADTLIDKATTKYNNMISDNQWKSNETKDAKLLALTTQVADLEGLVSKQNNPSSSNDKQSDDSKWVPGAKHVEKWRIVKDKGEECEVNGLTWWWCPHHKLDGVFDGLYVRHRPEDHNDWKKKKNDRRKPGASTDDTKTSVPQKLSMSDKLKSALMTKCALSESEFNDLIAESK